MEKMDEDNVYENVPTKTRPNKGVKGDAPQRRSKVTVKRVALVVLSLLLLAAVSAVIGHIVHLNSTSKNKAETMGKATTAPAPTEIKTTQKEMTTAVTTCLNNVVQCDTGWELNGTKCYYFSPQSLKLTWTNSNDTCRSRGADLVKIKSREEQKFVFSKLSNGDWYWIGLTDSETEGQWKWTDGSPLNQSVTFWWKEPDDWSVYPAGEDCAVILIAGNLSEEKSWADIYCDDSHGFICEKEATCVSR